MCVCVWVCVCGPGSASVMAFNNYWAKGVEKRAMLEFARGRKSISVLQQENIPFVKGAACAFCSVLTYSRLYSRECFTVLWYDLFAVQREQLIGLRCRWHGWETFPSVSCATNILNYQAYIGVCLFGPSSCVLYAVVQLDRFSRGSAPWVSS